MRKASFSHLLRSLSHKLTEMTFHYLIRRTHRYAGVADTQKVLFNPCGQVIGQIKQIESSKDVVFRLLNEYAETMERLDGLNAAS